MRYKVTLSYDGSGFRGWQTQHNGNTIQECLQNALSTLLNGDIPVTGAGRTDSGVHAIKYVAHFDAPEFRFGAKTFCYKLSAILPESVVVHEVLEAGPEFHARYDALRRDYKYFVHRCKDPFVEKYSLRCGYDLDVRKMNEAAAFLHGTQDFSCFEKVGADNKTSICTVTEAVWKSYRPAHVELMGYPAVEDDYLVFNISADRFLRNMVRAIVGTLIDIGRGRHKPEWMQEVLESRDRSAAGESVPGKALFLCGVDYPPETGTAAGCAGATAAEAARQDASF